jgi:hypothetical protein
MQIDEEDCSLSVGTGKLPVMTSCASTHIDELYSLSCRVTTHGLSTLDEPDLDSPQPGTSYAGKLLTGGELCVGGELCAGKLRTGKLYAGNLGAGNLCAGNSYAGKSSVANARHHIRSEHDKSEEKR